MSIQVIKRDGTKQPLDLDKFHKVVAFACDDITGVSASEIEIKSQIQFYNNIKSSAIQETLIKAAANLISEDTPNYQHVAGKLVNYHLRKEVYGQYEPIHLYEHVQKVVKKGFYDKDLLKLYTREEYDQLNSMIKHDRDEHLTYVAMEQFRGKYLVRDRVSGRTFETPQMAYILIAAVLFASYPKETRMDWVKKCYDAISQQEISLATPVLAGIRTPERQYASCTLIESADSRDGINATSNAVVEYISARAGLGIHGGFIRSEGSPVQGGAKTHTGKRGIWRIFQSSVKALSQGGIRGGSATMNWFFFDREFEDLIVLKDNRQVEENRLDKMDYCVHLNRLFYQRWLNDEDITLFSPSDIPEVVEAFYRNTDEFIQLYEEAEHNTRIKKVKKSARHLMELLVEQRFNTGRIYIMNADHVNDHGPYLPQFAPIKMTNLCVEVTNTTSPISVADPTAGEIALCILCALNVGVIKDHEQMMHLGELAVRMMNQLIDYQDYPMITAETATKKRRPIGVGIINLAYWIAKNNMTYSQPEYKLLHELFESYSYSVIYGSTKVAEEFGPCPGYEDTKWSRGILPIDTYKKSLDEVIGKQELLYDWDYLRDRICQYGIANSTLMCGMPGESSSQVANATSGFDPVRALVTTKQSKDGVMSQVVPEIRRLKNKYETLWEMPNTRGVLLVNAIAQKFMDQSISTNTSYNPINFENEEIDQDELTYDILYAYKLGIKTLYYNNVNDGATDDMTVVRTRNIQPEAEDDCEACKL